MSKSLGNTLTIRDMVRRHAPGAIRLYLLGTHYRHPLEFSDERIAESARALGRLAALQAEAERIAAEGAASTSDDRLLDEVAAQRSRFQAAMDDDFNTPQALGVLFDLARVLYTARDQLAHEPAGAGAFLKGVAELVSLARVLGLLEGDAGVRAGVDPALRARIDALVSSRQEARQRRDFAAADDARDELNRLGVVLEDTPSGTTWKLG
jgi:cysteinyl-tRNA synthetase